MESVLIVILPQDGQVMIRECCIKRSDITHVLKIGQNDISAMVGNGWYKGPITMHHVRNYYGRRER